MNSYKNNNIFDMNMLNYIYIYNPNNNILTWILWIIRKIKIFFIWILCIIRKIIIFTTQIIIFFILIPGIVEYFY